MRNSLLAIAGFSLALAACGSGDDASGEASSVPDTNATMADPATTPGVDPIEPGLGSPPEPGGGVPGSSNETSGAVNPDGTNPDPVMPRETPNP